LARAVTVGVVGGSTMWYLARATGITAFVLLTVTVALGVVTSLRWQTRNIPRFVIEYVHRNVTLVVLALIVIHVGTVVVDGFAPIGWIAAVVPFSSPYRPIWLSLGALGLDLLLAVAVTSWLRHRVGFRVWRFLHWSAYASWLAVLVHALGTGTDTREGWALLVEGGCALVVIAAVLLRIGEHWEEHTPARVAALVGTVLAAIAIGGFLFVGPLAPNWARRAGTPESVLARSTPRAP
jgi:methionine sulfoxide reductase heme-binding subunit